MSYNFTKEELEQLAVEPSWLKCYSMTTGRMVDNEKYHKVTARSNKKIIVDEAKDTGIVYEGEMVTNG